MLFNEAVLTVEEYAKEQGRLFSNQILNPEFFTTQRLRYLKSTMKNGRHTRCGWLPEFRDWNGEIVHPIDLSTTIICTVGCAYCFPTCQRGKMGKSRSKSHIAPDQIVDLAKYVAAHAEWRFRTFGRLTVYLLGQEVELGVDGWARGLHKSFLREVKLRTRHARFICYTKVPRPDWMKKFRKFKDILGWLVSLTNFHKIRNLEPGADNINIRMNECRRLVREGWVVAYYGVVMDHIEAKIYREFLEEMEPKVAFVTGFRFNAEQEQQWRAFRKVIGSYRGRKFRDCGGQPYRWRLRKEYIYKIDDILSNSHLSDRIIWDRIAAPGNLTIKLKKTKPHRICLNNFGECPVVKQRGECAGKLHDQNGKDKVDVDDLAMELAEMYDMCPIIAASPPDVINSRMIVHRIALQVRSHKGLKVKRLEDTVRRLRQVYTHKEGERVVGRIV